MEEPEGLKKVTEFHKLTGNNIEQYPTIPGHKRSLLRVSLIREELMELTQALRKGDLIEAADALCDIQYVLSGSVIELGLSECFAELFTEVHRSNMSKACKNMQEVEGTQVWYHREHGKSFDDLGHIKTTDGLYFVIDKSNHDKTLKSVHYSPANLKPIIDRHMMNTSNI